MVRINRLRRDLSGLRAFMDDYAPRRAIVVCTEPAERLHEGIRVLPWKQFLDQLWAGDLIS